MVCGMSRRHPQTMPRQYPGLPLRPVHEFTRAHGFAPGSAA